MSDHNELIAEMPSVERMATTDRLKHARKRRSQQLKKWSQYEKHLDKETSKKRKSGNQAIVNKKQSSNKRKVVFVPNIALLEAAARNDVNEVRNLLERNVNPDLTNDDGLTALHQCCIDDSEEMLLLLLEYGAKVNAQDSEHWTPLHAAATCGNANLCHHLINRGADLLSVNSDGNMPYDICEDETTLDYIETEMAKRGITQEEIDEKRLASEKDVLEDLEKIKAANKSLQFRDHIGATPLHIAAANGYIKVAQYLLDNQVDVYVKDNDSWQPIHAAAYWGQPDLVDILVQYGADIDAKTKNGETPFDLCEDPELKQKILDVKDELETNKASRGKGSLIKHRISSRSASLRRSSLRGDKGRLSLKEAKEEALHFGLRMLHDEEDMKEVDEDKENVPATNIDDVELILQSDDDHLSAKHLSKESKHEKHSPSSSKSVVKTITTTTTSNKRSTNIETISPASVPSLKPSQPASKPVKTVNQQPVKLSGESVKPTAPPSLSSSSAAAASTKATTAAKPTTVATTKTAVATTKTAVATTSSSSSSIVVPPVSTLVTSQPQNTNNQNRPISHINSDVPTDLPSRNPQITTNSPSTFYDLKKQRMENRKDTLDAHVQSMFVERANNNRHSGYSSPTDKTINGHNNNNTHTYTQEPVKRFVAPSNVAIVGEEDKHHCCIIM